MFSCGVVPFFSYSSNICYLDMDEFIRSFFFSCHYTIDNVIILLLDRLLHMYIQSDVALIHNGIEFCSLCYYFNVDTSMFYVCALNKVSQIVSIRVYLLDFNIGSIAFFILFQRIRSDFFTFL
jgi:hypothetical protein